MISKKLARPLSTLCNRNFLNHRTFDHGKNGNNFTLNGCSAIYISSRFLTVRELICDPKQKFIAPRFGDYIIGRIRALIFKLEHPDFKFKETLQGCEQAMSIVSDLIAKRQLDTLQGMIDQEVLNHLETKLVTASWVHPVIVDPLVKKFDWITFKEIKNPDTGFSKLSLDTVLFLHWDEFRFIHYYQFQRYFVGGPNQDWIITNISILRMDL
ncbi:uncharacterized protein LOC133173540 [Saccostrea echinata]|uniref:uncharacterized protein LOC133173540 n=1 Tax=Saccostrea echinata TaxID=191078 RepID=UPI002A8091E9|nr:uncharacterized protein LOC133173540 [Saccostrea echinata]